MRRPPAHGFRLAWVGGALLLFFLIVAAWPVGDGQAQSRADEAARPGGTRTPTPVPAAPGAAVGIGSRRQVLPVVRYDNTPTPSPTPTNTPTPVPQPLTNMAVGAGVVDNNYEMVRDMGFPWMKLNVDWAARRDVGTTESQVNDALNRYPGVKILLRIDDSPASARTGNDNDPIRESDLHNYLAAMASRLRGKVQAYELFNEPNLKWEWNTHIAGGSGMPSSSGYARIMQIAHPAVHGADQNAIVITGGLSPSGGGGADAIGDFDFLNGMYRDGATFDALGAHPYGGACSFDAGACSEGIYFRRAESYRAIMVSHGDNRQIWATELGWVVDPRLYGHPECMAGLGGRAGWVRSPADVGYQLSMAYRYAIQNWPWMGGMFFFNFDYSAAGWVQGYDKVCDAPAWYSIASKNNMPPRPYTEPAYGNLLQVARDYHFTSR